MLSRLRAARKEMPASEPALRQEKSIGLYSRRSFWKRHKRLVYLVFVAFAFAYGVGFSFYGQFRPLQYMVPLGMMGALVVWLLPETDRPPTSALYPLLMAFLVALLCWPDYIALVLPGLPWITAVRVTSFPLTLVFLICLSESGNLRRRLSAILAATPALWKLVVAFAVVSMISIVFSTDKSASIGRFIRAETGLTATFFLSAFVFAVEGRATRFCYVLWCCVLFLCAIGLWEANLRHLPWLGHIPSIFQVDPDTLEQILRPKSRAGTNVYRVQAVSTTPLGFAELLALSVPFILHIAFSSAQHWKRVCAGFTLPLIFYVIILTDSRLGIVGMLVSCMLYLLVWAIRKKQASSDSLLATSVVASYPLLFAGFIAATFLVGRLHRMVWGSGAARGSTNARWEQIAQGLPKVLSQPWGHGIGRASETLGWSSAVDGKGSIDSYYLSIALEFGPLGFLVFYGIFAFSIFYASKSALRASGEQQILAPLAIAMVNFCIIKAILSQDANHPLIFMMLGMITALVFREHQSSGSLAKIESRLL